MPAFVQRSASRAPRLDARVMRRRAELMLAELGVRDAELSVLLVDDPRIHELNRKHRKKNKPTDVLAFPMDAALAGASAPRLLGDVVVSLDTAARQARERGRGLVDEVTHLLAHGLLHLLGYDHRTDAEERRMDREAKRLVDIASGKRAEKKARPSHARSRLTPRAR